MSTGSEEAPPRQAGDGYESEWVDEGLFARDVDGRLIRYDTATREELEKEISLTIDGEVIQVKKAVVATDEMGRVRYGDDGQVIPRPTTIYDAVGRRYKDSGVEGVVPGTEGDGADDGESFRRAAGRA